MDASTENNLRRDLEALRAERRELIKWYGNRGQNHPMFSMLGGLSVAAQRLHVVRGQIAAIEALLRKALKREPPTMTPIEGGSYYQGQRIPGWRYDVRQGQRSGKIGIDNHGQWYAIENGEVVAQGLKTAVKARDAFGKLRKK